MSSFNIEFDSEIAERAYFAVENREYLRMFDNAEFKLESLIRVLEDLCSDADWLAYRLEQKATHYEYLQEDYYNNPQGFTEEEASDITSVKPSELNSCANSLRDGEQKVKNFIETIKDISNRLKSVRAEVEEAGKKMLDKISFVIEIMRNYLNVRF